MIVKLVEDITQKGIEIIIKFAHKTVLIERLVNIINSVDYTIKCISDNNNEVWINASDIYYIESVDKKTFVYCEKSIFQTDHRLYQLVEALHSSGFVQVNKACILNINVLESIRPIFHSRMEATLINSEKITISRKYIPLIKVELKKR